MRLKASVGGTEVYHILAKIHVRKMFLFDVTRGRLPKQMAFVSAF